MAIIIIESVLFVAFVAAGGALFVFVVREFTPIGRRWQQARNRRRIEGEADRTCPIHGVHAASALVRLPSGETMCPRCYQEILNGKLGD